MYYPYYYGFDWTYLYLVLPCVILSLLASHNVNKVRNTTIYNSHVLAVR